MSNVLSLTSVRLAFRVSRLALFSLFTIHSSLFTCSAATAAEHDPTKPSDAMADALKAQLTDAEGLKLHALVVGADEEGVALVGKTAAAAVAVRRGSVVPQVVDGVKVEVSIKSVTAFGVELNTSSGKRKTFLPGSFTPLAASTNVPAEFIRYLESDRVPIGRLMRLIADQTGVNISTSDATAEKTVSTFLRNVTAVAAVEEICRSSGLWFRREPDTGMIRVTSMKEYAENLTSFREETTKTFTLLYPNVVEIASVIYGLYPERTLLSLGEEEFQQDDEYDLSRRFRRFRVLEDNGNSQFMEMQAPRASSSGASLGGGTFSFSRGNALSRLNQWDRLQDRNRIGGNGQFSTPGAMLAADVAKRLETAAAAADTNAYETAYRSGTPGAANIFVSMSRKNNMLIVRTSDVKVMDEITRLVKELDVPTPMVLLEMRVLELQLDDNFSARFEWAFDGAAGAVGSHDSADLGQLSAERAVDYLSSAGAGAMGKFEPTFAFTTLSKHILSKIQLMAQDGKVKTLATPTLLVANNEVSRIFSGSERPIVTGWTPGSTVVSGTGVGTTVDTVPQIERKDVGTMLLVSPNINADKTVTLRLLQENSDIGGKADIEVYSAAVDAGESEQTQVAGTRKIDYIDSRSITGTFVAKDGMAVMAGGLIKETESEKYYRTPFLGSIPLLGWLFRGTEKVKNRTEMIILIKPHVIMTPMEGGKISAKLMKALSDHPAANGKANMGVFREGEDPAAKEHSIKDDFHNLVK